MAMTELEQKLLTEVQDMRREHERQQQHLTRLLQRQTETQKLLNANLDGMSSTINGLLKQLNEFERRLNDLSRQFDR